MVRNFRDRTLGAKLPRESDKIVKPNASVSVQVKSGFEIHVPGPGTKGLCKQQKIGKVHLAAAVEIRGPLPDADAHGGQYALAVVPARPLGHRLRFRVDRADPVPQFRLFFLLVHLHDHVRRGNRNAPKARAQKDRQSDDLHNVTFREIENRVAIGSAARFALPRPDGNRAPISGTTLRPLSESSR